MVSGKRLSRSSNKLVGDKPQIEIVIEPFDPYINKRYAEANKLNIKVYELAEEPDNDPASPEQAGWDKFET